MYDFNPSSEDIAEQMAREERDLSEAIRRYRKNIEQQELFNAGSQTPKTLGTVAENISALIKELKRQEENKFYKRSGDATRAIQKCLGVNLVRSRKTERINGRNVIVEKPIEKQRDFFDLEKAALIAVNLVVSNALAPFQTQKVMSNKGNDKRSHRQVTRTELAKRIGIEVMNQVCMEWLNAIDKEWFQNLYRQGSRRSKDVLPSSKFYRDYFLSIRAEARGTEIATEQQGEVFTDHPIYHFLIWNEAEQTQVGQWLITNLLHVSGDVFELKPMPKSNEKFVVFTAAAKQRFIDNQETLEQFIYGQLPMIIPPVPNRADRLGGWRSPASHKRVAKHKGTYVPSDQHLRVLNAAQNVPYQINPFVWKVLQHCRHNGRALGSFNFYECKTADQIQRPSQLAGIEQTEEGDLLWRHMVAINDPVAMKAKKDVEHIKAVDNADYVWNTASRMFYGQVKQCVDHEAIWCPMSFGPRGRMYFRTGYLNPQGEDHAKATLRYALPRAIDQRTEYWLKIELANAAGMDKESYDKRIEWVDDNMDNIITVARMFEDEIDLTSALCWLDDIDDAWVFLSACDEYYRCFITKESSTTQIRCGIDATAQAGQIIGGWRRSAEAAAKTNCLQSDKPSDVYRQLWEVVKDLCAHSPDGNLRVSIMRDWDRTKRGRSAMKAVLMVAGYGADKSCMCRDLYLKMKTFPKEHQLTLQELKLVNSVLLKAVDKVLSVGAMVEWCRKVATATHNTGRTILKLPTMPEAPGITSGYVVMKYPITEVNEIRTFTAGSCKCDSKFIHHHGTNVPDVERWSKAITANWVHSADQTLLCRALDGWEFNFTTIHDMFQSSPGLLMDLLYNKLRQSYYDIITWDCWSAIAEINGLKIDDGTLTDEERINAIPAPPVIGTLNPEDCLKSTYMFC